MNKPVAIPNTQVWVMELTEAIDSPDTKKTIREFEQVHGICLTKAVVNSLANQDNKYLVLSDMELTEEALENAVERFESTNH